ncbi:glycosyl hydrolase family 18 protein [Aureispira anguillae]|uniref:chitinase n=1 Tax=Aureispira anguillae TaxID=2864201 RepID=A0A916DWG0_9BACT|nr:glycosyl hydrolase family 18 protein [Aureispira anguillae]BDS14006.1 glycosyl hydrolase family 18 protein [Aureispira anguillae]
MKQSIITYSFAQLIFWCWLVVLAPLDLCAQLWGDDLDSIEQARITKRRSLQANSPIQERVDDKINERRLLMLAYEWWEVPTDIEQRRIDKALDSRYESYNTSLENSDWRNKVGVFYRSNNKISPKQNLTVLGWHPYWKGDTYKTYNYRLLTHLAYYGYEVNPFTGGYSNFEAIYDFIDSDLIMTAHLDSCKVLLTVSNRGYANNEIFFTSEPDVQRNLIDSLKSILIRSGADGIDLNFEEVPISQKDNFIAFVKELSFAIREDNNDYVISMSVPIYDKDNVYDLPKLKPWIDLFVISSFNFHIKPTELQEGPLSPLVTKDASIRGTVCLYQLYTTLDQLLAVPYNITSVVLEHDQVYETRLKDSLNYYIQRTYKNLEYKPYDITDVLNTIKITKDEDGRPLWQSPQINRLLRRTNCVGMLSQESSATKENEGVGFFIFSPKRDTLIFKELDLFENIAVQADVDSQQVDLNVLVDYYKEKIGNDHVSSLVLGLPYHGAVWYKDRTGEKDFEGYMPYSEILRLAEKGRASIDYDKATHSMEATVRDSLGGVYKIYFDNSTSLGRKFDFAIDEGLGGVGLWALGADYAHVDLWSTIEESFVTRRVWNEDKRNYGRITIDKENKVEYTILYLLKRFSNLIFATLFLITIFICISFGFSVLDWKVRDVLFYSGAFRIFYLVVFTIVILVLGNWMGWFQNKMITFAIGTGLGLLLTWVASNIVENRHKELP